MAVSGTAKVDCTTPQHGFTEEGENRVFKDVETWDVKKYPYLNHFYQDGAEGTAPAPEAGAAEPGAVPADEQILAAIQLLEPDNDEHWTEGQDPAMAAIEGILGDDRVSRADVERLAPQYDRVIAQTERDEYFNRLKGLFS